MEVIQIFACRNGENQDFCYILTFTVFRGIYERLEKVKEVKSIDICSNLSKRFKFLTFVVKSGDGANFEKLVAILVYVLFSKMSLMV